MRLRPMRLRNASSPPNSAAPTGPFQPLPPPGAMNLWVKLQRMQPGLAKIEDGACLRMGDHGGCEICSANAATSSLAGNMRAEGTALTHRRAQRAQLSYCSALMQRICQHACRKPQPTHSNRCPLHEPMVRARGEWASALSEVGFGSPPGCAGPGLVPVKTKRARLPEALRLATHSSNACKLK